MKYFYNPLLKTIRADWPGTPVDEQHRFVNLEFPFTPRLYDVFKWMFSVNPQRQEKKEDKFRLTLVNDSSFLKHNDDCIIWLGHATFFLRLSGINLLIDPVFFDVPFVKRYTRHAFSSDTFNNIDYLLISHDHQDHCQEKSIRRIVQQNPEMKILTGLNMEIMLRPWCKTLPIQMAGWYQQYDTNSSLDIFYMPSRHWSKRGLWDENKRLWGGFVLQTKEKTIYFGGDSGFGSHFREVGSLFPRISVAIMGIGAYKPEWFMHPNHVSPADAVRGFNEMHGKILIPMHYGTFDISDEPVGEPLRVLQRLQHENKLNGALKLLQLGENFTAF